MFLLVSLVAMSQTQQGYVKTLGRPNQKGVALSGVTIRAKGAHNAVLSNAQGVFSMAMPGKKNGEAYSLQQVQKQGYELNEQGVIGRQYAFSTQVPLSIVMVSTRQLQADKHKIEEKIYAKLESEYKIVIASLERQRDNNTISIEDYHKELQALQEKIERTESLIESIADHYARVDYDELTIQERKINLCIEQGRWEEAAAILQQTGVSKRADDIINRLKTGKRLMSEVNQAKETILKQQKKDAEYLYQLYTIALGRFDYDKATVYIETRAALDAENIIWQTEAGDYLDSQNQTKKALMYYNRALDLYNKKELTDEDKMYKAGVYNQLGNIYQRLNYPMIEVETAYMKSLNLYKELLDRNSTVGITGLFTDPLSNLASLYEDTERYNESFNLYTESLLPLMENLVEQDSFFEPDLALVQGNAAVLFKKMGHFDMSEKAYKRALSIYRKLAKKDPQEYESGIVRNLNGLSNLYTLTHQKDEAGNCIREAVPIMRRLVKTNPIRYEAALAESLTFLGNYCREKAENEEGRKAYIEALGIYRNLAKREPDEYNRKLAWILEETALLYSNMHLFNESETLFKEALLLRRHQVKNNPSVYEFFLASALNNFAIMYFTNYQYSKSEPLYREALSLFRKLYRNNPQKHQFNLSHTLCNLALTDIFLGDYTESKNLFEESLTLCKKMEKTNPKVYAINTATVMGNYAVMYLYMNQYERAEKMIRKAISKSPDTNWMQSTLALSLLFQRRIAESHVIYRKYKGELKDTFLDNIKRMEDARVIPPQYTDEINNIKDLLQ